MLGSFPGKAVLFLVLAAAAAGGFYFLSSLDHFHFPERAPVAEYQEPPPPPTGPLLQGRIAKGSSLSAALRALHIEPELAEAICQTLKSLVDLRRSKPGDTFDLRLTPEGKLRSFSYKASPLDVYQITAGPSGEWFAEEKEIPVEKYWARISGEIRENLFEAVARLGEEDSLVLEFADILASQIDFHSEPQPGDRIGIVVEKYYAGDQFIRYGRILYIEYASPRREVRGFYFQPAEGGGDYYSPEGESLRKTFLRSPLKFTRITSSYSQSRLHPILGVRRPHLGVDYAAPPGTPVLATADGRVSFCGRNGGYGNQVILTHAGGYQSMYGHLRRFGPGIQKGKFVRQKQVIGYVGSTGLSTGPHLDFRLRKNNRFCDPLKEISPAAVSLARRQMAAFRAATGPLVRWLEEPVRTAYRLDAVLSSRDI